MWWVQVAFGQGYEAQPCQPEPDLAAEVAAGMVRSMSPRGPGYQMAIASTLLPPPASLTLDAASMHALYPSLLFDEDNEAIVLADARSCAYGATNLLDGDPATAWCEGAKGPGVGEVVLVAMPEMPKGELAIRNGYGKSAERYAQNGRARGVEVVLLGQGWEPPVQGALHSDLPVLGRHEIELADTADWQPLALPTWSYTPPAVLPGMPGAYSVDQRPHFVGIRILSTWPGTKWEDTCLSEIGGR